MGQKKRLQPNVGQVLGNSWCAKVPKKVNSVPKIGIGDHLMAQKGDQRPQESTGEEGMEGHVAQSGRLKPEVGHIGRPREGQVPNL